MAQHYFRYKIVYCYILISILVLIIELPSSKVYTQYNRL